MDGSSFWLVSNSNEHKRKKMTFLLAEAEAQTFSCGFIANQFSSNSEKNNKEKFKSVF